MWVSSFPISAGRSATYSSATTTSTTTFGGYFNDVQTTQTAINNQMVTLQGWQRWVSDNRQARQTGIWNQWTVSNWTDDQLIRAEQDVPVVHTAAEIAEQADRLHRAFMEERSRKLRIQEEIEKRAEELFLSFLNEEQRESYRKKKEVVVCAKSGTRYRIFCAGLGRIRQLDTHGREIAQFCSHVPYGELPGADNWLAQMLAVRFDEKEGFLLRANRSPLPVMPPN